MTKGSFFVSNPGLPSGSFPISVKSEFSDGNSFQEMLIRANNLHKARVWRFPEDFHEEAKENKIHRLRHSKPFRVEDMIMSHEARKISDDGLFVNEKLESLPPGVSEGDLLGDSDLPHTPFVEDTS